LGAAKTSAYYALAPFIGAFLSFVLLKEELTLGYAAALLVMIAGTAFVVCDTLRYSHEHEHTHTFTHTHTVTHAHMHSHMFSVGQHGHHHSIAELEKLSGAAHG
jgi:hypothetical protein